MFRIFIIICSLQCLTAYGQSCPILLEPGNDETNVPVNSPIRWSEVSEAVGYVISMGTSPGDDDIISNRSSGLRNSYVPQTGLPADAQIYITIGYYKQGREFVECEEKTFRTAEANSPPDCATLSAPTNGAPNISVETKLEWGYAARATGYRLSVGTAPGGTDVIDDVNVGDKLEYRPPKGLPSSTLLYVTLTPYNETGEAESCSEERFTTATAIIDCGPYFDAQIGADVFLGPEIDFPDQIGLCRDSASTIIESNDKADGYRWYIINPDGSERLLSSTKSVELVSVGNYRYEAYKEITRWSDTAECANSKTFNVVNSEAAVITAIDDDVTARGRRLEIHVSGVSSYEFALENIEGPYQESPIFEALTSDSYDIYVRDLIGCGITKYSVPRNPGSDNFPKFFTPNGDDVNDYWQFILLETENEILPNTIEIFDRYGNLLTIINPESKGWDGTLNGRPLPSSDYWFRAVALNGQVVRGHFSLKR